ncbi:hypothetical protein [Streptomyces sp. Tu 6176]|uniref:hypothetical protein n=1 Tax=Streptomyces sp. Tu 6176 TaxID=1470557 RepID=UPI001319DFF7|nr:hypothetical protein [Streptomyces sp. Tu 6176]
MAKTACKCGNLIRDDDPDFSLILLPYREFDDVEADAGMLLGRGIDGLRCSVCGRLWVFWDEGGNPVEYVEVRD